MSWNKEIEHSQIEHDRHSDDLNPNNDVYWEARGYEERPDDWEDRINNENE